MPGITIAALFTVLVTAGLSAAVLDALTHSDRRNYWLVLAGLPLSFLVNRLVKIPLINGIGALLGIPLQLSQMPIWFILVVWMTAPIF